MDTLYPTNHNLTNMILPSPSSFLMSSLDKLPSLDKLSSLGEIVPMDLINVGGGVGLQNMLNSHFLLYSLRQNVYGMILTQSNLYKELLEGFKNMTYTEIMYYGIFVSAACFFLKDMSYKKSMEKIKENQVISYKMVKIVETVLFVVMMVLFQDVGNATG